MITVGGYARHAERPILDVATAVVEMQYPIRGR
jgi:hypothetical protein